MRLSADKFRQVIASLRSDARSGKNKRREPRVGLPGEVDYFTFDSSGARVCGTARMRDVSPGGIGMIFPISVAQHQQLILQLSGHDTESIWLVCQVAYCRRIEGGFFSVGATVKKQLCAADLKKAAPEAAAVPRSALAAKPLTMSDVDRISKAILK